MKLISFRIQHFRSIRDTGWQNLSPDHITCLIGQNESGKTSVLEGLLSFYSGRISEDVLRSDLSLPEVSCRFSVKKGWLATIPGKTVYGVVENLEQEEVLELRRYWQADFSSEVRVDGSIGEEMDSQETAWKKQQDSFVRDIEDKWQELSLLAKQLSEHQSLCMNLREEVDEYQRKTGRTSVFRKKRTEAESPDIDPATYNENKKKLQELEKEIREEENRLKKEEVLFKALEEWNALQEEYLSQQEEVQDLQNRLEERHQSLTLMLRPEEYEQNRQAWDEVMKSWREAREKLALAEEKAQAQTLLCHYLLSGEHLGNAREKADKTIREYRERITPEQLGKVYAAQCPSFEMFEDFGSLLPNRIDMEDIISNNPNIEGYKAARNFLTIAQLDYSFFQQPSNRILKQKIENLNNELTENFQDFWQQCVYTKNKIQIQFELNHYDSSREEKSGKPYLEFWIKDQGERLYPKQRSRGVRWFLSFYLEMKASAMKDEKNKVLLIDEPGVSLHARAQEDVLKVFEDVKERLQIIYTTHSPHLVDIDKLHRVLAVQRNDAHRNNSTTVIIEPTKLAEASPDTLSPLQTVMGNPVEGFSMHANNIIVNNIGSFYLLNALVQIAGLKEKVHFIPSTDVEAIPLMCNILMGWGVPFRVLLFNNQEEKRMAEKLRKTLFSTEGTTDNLILNMPEEFENTEDLFSTLDFKKLILKTREGIPIANSRYIIENRLPREFLFSTFLNEVKNNGRKKKYLDEESLENLDILIKLLQSAL